MDRGFLAFSRRLLSFERIALGGAVLFVGYLLTRYDLCFQDAEVLTGRMFDHGSRPRVISYLGWVLTLETRLALWRVLPPHPSFTPMWILTLVVGPILLFQFLQTTIGSRVAALAGVAVYLVSAGFLNGVTMLFHPGKPLANVVVIATFCLSANIDRALRTGLPGQGAALRLPDRRFVGLLALLAVAPFVDETAAFAYAIPLVWCPSVFWPNKGQSRTPSSYLANWVMYVTPACLGAVVILKVLPRLVDMAGGAFDLPDYFTTIGEGAERTKVNVLHVAWQAGNLLIPGLLPWSVANVRTPVAATPDLPVGALIGLAVGLLVGTVTIHRGQRYWSVFRKVGILIALFVLFESLVLVFHPRELSATGFYYGAIISVLFASLVAVVFADLSVREGTIGVWAARLGLVWVLGISAVNFLALNASWMAHSNSKALSALPELIGEHRGDRRSLEALQARHHDFYTLRPRSALEQHYATDIEKPGPAMPFGDVFAIWRQWRRGDVNYAAGRALAIRDLWIVVELGLRTKPPAQRWKPIVSIARELAGRLGRWVR